MTLKRTPSTPKPRPTTFYDAREGVLTTPDGKSIRLNSQGGPTAILDALAGIDGASVVYLVGGETVDDAPAPDWYKKPAADGWQVEYRHDATPARRSATYTRAGRAAIQFRHSAAWFGPERRVRYMRMAFATLSSRLNALFGTGVLLGSPAQTGLLLLERSLPFGVEYETLPEDVLSHLRAISPQARREVFSFAPADEIPAFYYYDARLAYGACLRGVPSGEIAHVRPAVGATIERGPYTRGVYFAEWRVPSRWAHIGILPEHPLRPAEPWEWPAQPGTWHRGWVWSPALDAARNEGWEVRIHEGYEWIPRTAKGGDPLRTWGDKLLTLSMEATPRRYGPLVAPLVKSAIRAMLLATIGSFHRRETREWRIVPLGEPMDYPMTYPRELTPWGWQVEVPRPIPAHRMKFAHPEWSAWIWATQYSRMTRRMLAVYPGDLLGCNTDAIYTTAKQGHWDDSGKIGDYRLKGRIWATRRTPHSLADLAALKTESEELYHAENA